MLCLSPFRIRFSWKSLIPDQTSCLVGQVVAACTQCRHAQTLQSGSGLQSLQPMAPMHACLCRRRLAFSEYGATSTLSSCETSRTLQCKTNRGFRENCTSVCFHHSRVLLCRLLRVAAREKMGE